MSIKPLTLWGHWGAPNPFKVCMVLEALGLPYETCLLEFSEVKQESYVKLNPNGRLPTLQDPNTGLNLSEVSYNTTELLRSCDDAKQVRSLAR
jgi:glutathione S-transferase